MAQPVVHFEIAGKDSAKTREFYTKMFDWRLQEAEGMDYAMMDHSGEGTIGGGITGVRPGQSPNVTIYIQVDDLQKYLDKAESLGGKTLVPPMPIPGGSQFAQFADPDGNVIGIYSSGK